MNTAKNNPKVSAKSVSNSVQMLKDLEKMVASARTSTKADDNLAVRAIAW
ncbi:MULTISPECIES: hypothetical protein [unclassified Rahnella]|nr:MULTISPECIES: hypothetical protein [unclassified Rahnella]MCM2446904.1 hypothetical protein [Rahnella sp. CG8]